MKKFSAYDAKARFGTLIDAARREPVTIEKHGRAVAVVLSKEEFDEIQAMKLELLRAEVRQGIDASNQDDAVEIDESDLDEFIDRVMSGTGNPATTG